MVNFKTCLGLFTLLNFGHAQITIQSQSPRARLLDAMAEDEAVQVAAGKLPKRDAKSHFGLSLCKNGMAAGEYPCKNIDMLSVISHQDMGSSVSIGNDIWGWTDPWTRIEYGLVGQRDGTAFVRIWPSGRVGYLGRLNSTEDEVSVWRDIKVYKDHAYIVADEGRDQELAPHGIQVFDLRRLRFVRDGAGKIFDADTIYFDQEHHSSHNIFINEKTGYLYSVGGNSFEGGLHIVDINDPDNPKYAGNFAEDEYVHDTQCVVYDGPDTRYTGHEICACFNEDTVTMVDVTDKSAPKMIARVTYEGVKYCHQGWFTEDLQYMLSNDELDERDNKEEENGGSINGTAMIWDMRDLENPTMIGKWESPVETIDHNMYIRGNKAYLANNSSGMRVLDVSTISTGKLEEIAYFDVYPEEDVVGFLGSWSVYPWLRNNKVIINSRDRGMFVVRLRRFLRN